MCTVSIISIRPPVSLLRQGYGDPVVRLVCNRDELESRPEALPPRVTSFGAVRGAMPIDPASGGSWIGVNEAGVAMTLLNSNPWPAPPPGATSRGEIIPRLLRFAGAADASIAATMLDAKRYAPFRLVILDRKELAEVTSDGQDLTVSRRPRPEEPVLFTSSGLGDGRVGGPRRRLFQRMVDEEYPTRRQQDDFHRHRWEQQPDVSVWMCREGARTVSRTVIELSPGRTTLCYRPVDPLTDWISSERAPASPLITLPMPRTLCA
jgi:hypothetical protein